QMPESAIGREAGAFIELLSTGGGGATTEVYGATSFQYDTNVILAPAGGFVPGTVSNQADERITLNVGRVWVPWKNETSRFSVGYDLYQNLQFHLTNFNLQDHRPTVQFTHDFGLVHTGVLAQYDFYFEDGNKLLQEVTALPYVTVPEQDIGRTEL